MQRRTFLKGCAAVTSAATVPAMAALSVPSFPTEGLENTKELFARALEDNANLIGFKNIEHDFSPAELTVEGKIPADFQGTFYRNGPARHERSDVRYQHLFEGDGMLQSFKFENGKVRHQGKFIKTPKYVAEEKVSQFLYSGPDTKLANPLPVSSSEVINTANTNVIGVGGDLWALWEAGSPTRVDVKTLEYKERVNLGENSAWGNKLKGMPFSAHPKIEANGDIWNFGLNPTGHVVLYHLAANGELKNVGLVDAKYKGGMLHDFLVTHKSILLILPSLVSNKHEAGQGFFSSIKFDNQLAMKVLVINKSDFTVEREYELPSGFAFHFGNAWEDSSGDIRFDASLYPDLEVLVKLGKVMQGEDITNTTHAKTTLVTLRKSGIADIQTLDTNTEFPRIHDHLVGRKNNLLFHLSAQANDLWSDTVCKLDVNTGNTEHYYYGKDFLVEEHVAVSTQQKEGSGYLLGTALHVSTARTCINLFKIENIAAGPVARAWLPYHLPLGFHGNFVTA